MWPRGCDHHAACRQQPAHDEGVPPRLNAPTHNAHTQSCPCRVAAAALRPLLLQRSIALPDVHSGYGFAIGNVAAFDMNNPEVGCRHGMCVCAEAAAGRGQP